LTYLIDSNIFIQAQNEYYCMDICPGFWDFLSERFHSGELISIRQVYDEISHKDDPIYEWVKDKKSFFSTVDDEATQRNFGRDADLVVMVDCQIPADDLVVHFL